MQALKHRVAKHGLSAEARHRETLRQALLGPKKKSFAQVLAEVPNIGLDSDFDRTDDFEGSDVFN